MEQRNLILDLAKTVRMKAASEAQAQQEDYAKYKARTRNKVPSEYNLMALFTGGPVITSRDDDVIVPTSKDNILKMYAGSSSSSKTSTDSESVTEKQYKLMRLLTGGGR